MVGLTVELRGEMARISRMIDEIESKPRDEFPRWAPTLRSLEQERRRLDLMVRHRRQEARKKVVDFTSWRNGL